MDKTLTIGFIVAIAVVGIFLGVLLEQWAFNSILAAFGSAARLDFWQALAACIILTSVGRPSFGGSK